MGGKPKDHGVANDGPGPGQYGSYSGLNHQGPGFGKAP